MSGNVLMLATFMAYTGLLVGLAVMAGRSMAGVKAKEYVDEFYTGGRGVGAFVVAMVLASGLCSAGTFVGTPGLAYKNGLTWTVLTNWQNFMNLMVLGVLGKKVGIIARRINARSFLDIFGARYEDNKAVILLGGLSMLIFLIPYATIQFVGGARMFEVMTGVNYYVGLLLITIVVILYTGFGGIKGTTLAAAIQGVVMTLAAILIFTFSATKLGGLTAAMQKVEAVNPELLTATAAGGIATPRYLASFAVLFGFAILGMPHGITPALIYKNSKAMLRSVVIGAIAVTLWTVLMATTGTLARAVDPNLAIPDHATATMTAWGLPPVLQGIVLAGVTAAMQSTVASMLILISGSLLMDVYAKVIRPGVSLEQIAPLARWVTLALGVVAFALALSPPHALEWIVYFAVAGLESSFFVPLLFGLYWRRANTPGAIAGMVGGLGGYILIAGYLKNLSFGMHPVVMGLAISFVSYIVVTMLTPPPSEKVLQLYWGGRRVAH
ncbi:MAG TPA: sodium/panthothenate symporter [Firmicutes bacterium]|nr:sodium/panthothenate symporter [Bacillota bacterium]